MLTSKEKRLYLYFTLFILIYSLAALLKPSLAHLSLTEENPSVVKSVPKAVSNKQLTPSKKPTTQPVKPKTAKLDLNDASLEELQSVKGIGPVIAQRILEQKKKLKGFKNWPEVLKVKGIGTKKLQLLKEKFYLTEQDAKE